MSRNIKEIGKELMGKSLNSFHRKTGLTQLEENNKMQDGILDGILSQVDDAYIEKTEQSNVIHLDGSGDGVVATIFMPFSTRLYLLFDATSLSIQLLSWWLTIVFPSILSKTTTPSPLPSRCITLDCSVFSI